MKMRITRTTTTTTESVNIQDSHPSIDQSNNQAKSKTNKQVERTQDKER